VTASPHPTIVVGDFNATLWSKPVRRLFAATDLRAPDRWPLLTYPATYFWPLRIPIDTMLVSPGLSFVGLQRVQRFGSDHFPIVAQIAIGGRW
jgi:endonuclease/exonuclease/phosphatase (EEP) superfamily protein YafD